MNDFICYHAIAAKTQSRKHILLNPADWEQLLNFSTTEQIINFIKNKEGYKEYFEPSTEQFHRHQLELALEKLLVGEVERMMHYMTAHYKKLFKVILMKYEIHDLQLIFRGISKGESLNLVYPYFIHSTKFENLPFEKIVECKNVKEVVESLQNTIFYKPLKNLSKEDLKTRQWHMEMQMNNLLYKSLYEQASWLEETDKEVMLRIIGIKVDCINIEWIYRAKKYYNISNEEILLFSLNQGYKIKYNSLKKLVYAENSQQFKKMCEQFMNTTIFDFEDELLEKCLNKIFYDSLNKKENMVGIGSLIGYIYKLEMEQKDVVAIAEGLRYKLSHEEIKTYLINIT
ncbi:MAG: hypothetical protein ATN36_07275 [Epulopiscium sp. Nele67-Bin005]|nr:MAG: hypothetical protein ATN36_07275 [Epulopiscium sp. Nele67-Bin005]